MTDHQPMPVHGYTVQSDARVRDVNTNKQLEEHILRRFDAMKENPDIDQRWLAIARTDIEKGFMAANRAIFKPGRVDVRGDGFIGEAPHEDSAHGLQPMPHNSRVDIA